MSFNSGEGAAPGASLLLRSVGAHPLDAPYVDVSLDHGALRLKGGLVSWETLLCSSVRGLPAGAGETTAGALGIGIGKTVAGSSWDDELGCAVGGPHFQDSARDRGEATSSVHDGPVLPALFRGRGRRSRSRLPSVQLGPAVVLTESSVHLEDSFPQ